MRTGTPKRRRLNVADLLALTAILALPLLALRDSVLAASDRSEPLWVLAAIGLGFGGVLAMWRVSGTVPREGGMLAEAGYLLLYVALAVAAMLGVVALFASDPLGALLILFALIALMFYLVTWG